MTISTKSGLSCAPKELRSVSKYAALEMSDDSVYDLARHYYTLEEIAERFSVSTATVKMHHSDAFHKGKDQASRKPRMLLDKIFRDFEEAEVNFANADVPMQTLLAAMKLHAQKYEGLGKTEAPIIHIDSKPSVSDITFTPLKAPQ